MKVICFSIWGNIPMHTQGALINIELAKEYGVSKGAIQSILCGKSWKRVHEKINMEKKDCNN